MKLEQIGCVEAARPLILSWAEANGIPLHHVEFVIPFVQADLSLDVWFFYRTDGQSEQAESLGWPVRLESAFRDVLRSAGYAEESIPEVRFGYDSHENVERNYEGSYFYRMR